MFLFTDRLLLEAAAAGVRVAPDEVAPATSVMRSSRGLVDSEPDGGGAASVGDDDGGRTVKGERARVLGLPVYLTRAGDVARGAGDGVLRARMKPLMYACRSSVDVPADGLARPRPSAP